MRFGRDAGGPRRRRQGRRLARDFGAGGVGGQGLAGQALGPEGEKLRRERGFFGSELWCCWSCCSCSFLLWRVPGFSIWPHGSDHLRRLRPTRPSLAAVVLPRLHRQTCRHPNSQTFGDPDGPRQGRHLLRLAPLGSQRGRYGRLRWWNGLLGRDGRGRRERKWERKPTTTRSLDRCRRFVRRLCRQREISDPGFLSSTDSDGPRGTRGLALVHRLAPRGPPGRHGGPRPLYPLLGEAATGGPLAGQRAAGLVGFGRRRAGRGRGRGEGVEGRW